MEDIFKVGDRVFHLQNGWGTVLYSPKDVYYLVRFDDNGTDFWYTRTNNKVLSFTEYTLEGFSQERPEELPKKGDIVWGFEVERQRWVIGHFLCKEKYGAYLISASNDDYIYYRVSKLTHTNPYENESN